MTTQDDYPGRTLSDDQRSPRGLGWEYRRRGKPRGSNPFRDIRQRDEFFYGWDHYICSDPEVDRAMLTRGVPMESRRNEP